MTEAMNVLGREVRHPVTALDTFEAPADITEVAMTAHEFTSLCPVTGQPDFGEVEIRYRPRELCIESKSLKLWLWGFREEGAFCEALASRIAGTISETIDPWWVEVTVRQASRGGIRTAARARRGLFEDPNLFEVATDA